MVWRKERHVAALEDNQRRASYRPQLLRKNPSANRRRHPDLVYFTLSYENRPLPSRSDFDRFEVIDEKLEQLEQKMGCVLVATMTAEGKRDWIFYAGDAERVVSGLLLEFGEHSPQMETQRDPSWNQYKELVKMSKL